MAERLDQRFVKGVAGFIAAGALIGSAACAGYAVYSAGRSDGYLAGLNEGWSDCNTPMADIKRGETRCPGSDLPRSVGLNLQ